MVRSTQFAARVGTSYQTLQTANALKNSMYPSPTFSAGACSQMMDWMISSPSRVARASLMLPCAHCSAVIMLIYVKPTALKLHHKSMLTSCSQCPLNVILGRCKMSSIYDNARVSVEMMTGYHVTLLKAVPGSIQNIYADAVVDQEERSRVDHRRPGRRTPQDYYTDFWIRLGARYLRGIIGKSSACVVFA